MDKVDEIGSPAWAGIDRSGSAASSSRRGFPRVGGDRPLSPEDIRVIDSVPPRGRG